MFVCRKFRSYELNINTVQAKAYSTKDGKCIKIKLGIKVFIFTLFSLLNFMMFEAIFLKH